MLRSLLLIYLKNLFHSCYEHLPNLSFFLDNESISSGKIDEVEDDRISQATQKTRAGSGISKKSSMSRVGSAVSKKSNLSRIGSAKSQKSVVWSTSGISEVGSEFLLLDDEKGETKEKKKNCCAEIISGKMKAIY